MSEESLFEQALNVPEPERAAFLDRVCAGNPDLRARVDALLSAHFAPDPALAVAGVPPDGTRSLDTPVTGKQNGEGHTASYDGGAGTASFPPSDERAGVVIAGRYKLLQQIGEGGMGTVWMAAQTEPVKRNVAVKLIRADRGQSRAILARFEAERQAIALMDHPHIARLLDAGTSESGQPFFVMELVKGVPLNEYCDVHRLSIPDRLSLFAQICGAVQHAHQKGIIHRDLKPGNILVESHDGKPVPKVIDFGLAKATTGLALTENTLFTGFGSVLGTPLYMAPEQASFNAVDVDTRADVYALGVILYELLTGTTPLTRDTLKKAAFDEMLKLIREQDAVPPSSRLSHSDNAPSVAANRQTEPGRLGRLVKGELDWIVLKAISKDRDRRYETANGFARDVERFLNHEPVTAGPPSARYRLRKFVRRNRPQVVAAGLVLVALVAGIAGTTAGLLEARGQAANARAEAAAKEVARAEEELQRGIAEANEQRAVAETVKALAAADEERKAKERERQAKDEAVRSLRLATRGNDILGSVFVGLDPRMNYLTVGEFAEALRANARKAAKELDEAAVGDPVVAARLRHTLGASLLGLGDGPAAVGLFERARDARKAALGPDHPDTIASMNDLTVGYL
ncbi:MAG: protein kinase, partial [Gemmataceae bacterium]|nr:protein kinase [Gemmataceae bacterium]